MKQFLASTLFKTLYAILAVALSAPGFAQQTFTYDFTWYSGASQSWVYEAGAKLFVDVYEDTTTAENDVLFRVRNGIDTELGYESNIRDMQIDTGMIAPDMFTSLSLAEHSAGIYYFMYTPGVDRTTLLDLAASNIIWTGDYAAGRVPNSTYTAGIMAGEYIVLRAVLKPAFTFSDVINAMNAGMSSTYMEGHLGDWTTAERDAYRTGAPQGLRLALLVHSIVPNSWHPDGHGLFVTHRLAGSIEDNSPQITSLTATPTNISDMQTSQLAVVASDPDAGPQPLYYQWTIVSGGGMLDNPISATPLYTPDNVTGSQVVTLQVDVSDGETAVSRTLILQVADADAPPPNVAPQISALTAVPPTFLDTETTQLTVTATDADAGPQALSYQWTVVSGGGVLDNATSATPAYTPADVVGNQTVILRVDVSDGEATVSGNLTLQVQDANPPPLGPELLFEDFSSGSLAGWTVRDEGHSMGPSKWGIKSGELAQTSNIYDGTSTASGLAKLGTYLLYDGGMDWADYRMKFVMRATDDDVQGVMFRYRDADNYYRFSWDSQLKYRRLVKKENGVFTELAADNVPYVKYQRYQIEIVAQSNQLEVWVDGTRILQVSDDAHDQGTMAFYTWRQVGAYFDDLMVNSFE